MTLRGSPLNSRFTLDAFVEAPGNALAKMAVKEIAEHERFARRTPSPLYIRAGEGLGKTHLLQALAAALGGSALYFTAEEFRFAALRVSQQGIPLFDALHDVDTIIIDDLHLVRLDAEVGSLYRPLIAFFETGRHIVTAADCSPFDLEGVRPDLRSRLVAGLVAHIPPMDESLRAGIVSRCIDRIRETEQDFDLTPEAIAHIAGLRGATGRTLEGILNGLVARYRLTGEPVSTAMVETVVSTVYSRAQAAPVTLDHIIEAVATYYGVTPKELRGARRARIVARPRQVVMYLAKIVTGDTLPMIGRGLGGRDHTTVMAGIKRIEDLAAQDTSLAKDLRVLKLQLEQ